MTEISKLQIVFFTVGIFSSLSLAKAGDEKLEEISVIGVSPLSSGSNLLGSQFAASDDIERIQSSSLTDFLDQGFLGITVNQAQNNPLQPDLQYRGFAASSALGLQQGLTVYQNGVRINEPFGETVNWDLLAKNTIADLQLVSGGNPLFGLNSLGGSLAINTKTGFTSPESKVEASFGSFSRKTTSLSFGGNNEKFGHFFSADVWGENGWRDFSESKAVNLYAALSWVFDDSELNVFYNHADTDLKGNGAAPIELLELSRTAVFTHPDRTENNLDMLNVRFNKQLSVGQSINANIFYRRNKTDGFNGDGSSYDECSNSTFADLLCLEDDDQDIESDALDDEEDFGDDQLIFDQHGNLVSAGFDAINNLTNRSQVSFGANVEWSALVDTSDLKHNLIAGLSFIQGRTKFDSAVEFASLNEDRATSRSGLFDVSAGTDLLSQNETAGIYLSDTIEFGQRWEWALTARYNSIKIISADQSGFRPALDAEHRFSRLNLGISPRLKINETMHAYLSWGQSMRSPSPVELACSHPDAPCTLPNTFLADPPLDEVVSSTVEIGIRGMSFDAINWQLGAFYIRNKNDIIFQTTGGVSSNVGFFDNVGDTRRLGIEASVKGIYQSLDWYLNYTYLKATFESSFMSSSPNHPLSRDGGVQVIAGDSLPGLPDHNLALGMNMHLSKRISLGLQVDLIAGQYLRGDEANLLAKLDAYSVVDLNVTYQHSNELSFSFEMENMFDSKYHSFGLLGEPDEIFESFSNPVFLSSSAPRGAWLRASYQW